MALSKKFNPFLKSNNDTGFGNSGAGNTTRFINKDGSFNVRREGIPPWNKYSVYNYFLNVSSWQFLLMVLAFYLLINLVFTTIYVAIGTQQFTGFVSEKQWDKYLDIFFFSAQTFTTVGYGRINPIGFSAGLVSAIEALTGLLTLALMTGLMYGRFARPKSNLIFSANAIVAPYRGIKGLMFRFVSTKETHPLTDVTVKVNLGMLVMENEKPVYKFYDLPLERTRVDSLPMNFTVVHPIDESSPLYNMEAADMATADVELYVLVRAFDAVYSTTVQQRTSYIFTEITHGVEFAPMYHESEDGLTTIIDLDKLNELR